MDVTRSGDFETEHGLARDGLAKVVELVAEPGFGAAVESLKAGVTHHVEEEEGEMFPKLRAGTPDQVQDELATQMLAAKVAAGLPVVPPEATKEQLVTLAGQLEIDGRSQMSKDELVDAINRKGLTPRRQRGH